MPAIDTRLIVGLPLWVPPGMVRGTRRSMARHLVSLRLCGAACAGRLSGRNGTSPFSLSSTTTDGEWVRISCIVSRYMRRSVTSFAV